jgi:DNA adenine methylase
MEFYSPLRYPGGKGKVAEYFKQIFKDNLLYDGVYIEPYAGGASVALSLLFNEYASKIIINDIDRSIFSFWHSVLNKPEEICKLINDTPVNIETWHRQKEIQKNKAKYGLLKVGFATFFLNRTNRSGILNAGVIGGQDQSGNWKMDARFNKKDLINRIQKIASYSKKIELHNSDAVELVKSLKKTIPSKSLFYFDPPYYVKGKDLYLNYYQDNDHKQIATEIGKLNKQKWIITYDSVPAIKNLYTDFRQVKYSLNYSAAQAIKGEELMIFSDNLFIARHSILKNN